MQKRITSGIVLTLIAVTATPVTAGQNANAFHPLGPVDLYTGSLAHFDLHLGIGDEGTALVPQIGFQYGMGSFAVGIELGLSYADVDTPLVNPGAWPGDASTLPSVESDVWPGDILFNIKGRHCLGEKWKTCFGGEFNLGFGFADLDTPDLLDPDLGDEIKETAGELSSLVAGSFAELRLLMYPAGVEHLLFQPVLAASTSNGMFVFHAYFGPAIVVPLDDLEFLGGEVDTDNEAALVYGLGLGGILADLFGGTVGFRGLSTLTQDDDESYFSLDLTLRLLLDGISPAIRFGIPLDDISQDVYDLVITFGVTAEI